MLKRLKLKSLLPSSALRSNSAALRLSKTPPQGGVFVSGAELFPGWRLTPYPGYKCSKASLRAAKPKHRTRRSPGQRRATGGQAVPVPQTGHQPPKASLRAANPNTAPAVAPVSNAPPGDKRCQCRRPDRRSSDQRFFMSAIDLCRVNGRHKKTTPPEGGVAVVNTGLCLTSCRSLSA